MDARRVTAFRFQELDAAGQPLAGGLIYTYEPGTSAPKTSWADPNKSAANSNPVVLDAQGRAAIYLDGMYRIVVADSAGVVQYTVDNVDVSVPVAGGLSAASEPYGTDTGTMNAYSISTGGEPLVLFDGLAVSFRATNANTGASTLNVNALGAITIKKPLGATYQDLSAGDIIDGAMVSVIYDATDGVWKTRSTPALQNAASTLGVSADDTTPGYLDGKVTVAAPLAVATTNPGGDERLHLSLDTSALDADTVDNYHATPSVLPSMIPVRDPAGDLPGDITGDAATVGGFTPSQTSDANAVAVRDANGALPGDITGSAATLGSLAPSYFATASHGHPNASPGGSAGFMSAEDKTKLDNIVIAAMYAFRINSDSTVTGLPSGWSANGSPITITHNLGTTSYSAVTDTASISERTSTSFKVTLNVDFLGNPIPCDVIVVKP